MLKTISDLTRFEEIFLAPYALKSSQSRGRKYAEDPHLIRTSFQRDRDRILHSRAFRRLEHKTQVFLDGTGDHYRTRLTHTIEVAAIARTLARTLGLNEDLAETIALAHDIGHPPFGHTGEYKLDEIMKAHNLRFDHNEHSLKLVDELIEKYPGFEGLNLTWETRTGLIKHRKGHAALDGEELLPMLSLEAQVADIADDLTYCGHDVDDGLESELITEKDLSSLVIWQKAAEISLKSSGTKENRKSSDYIVRCLIDSMVKDVTTQSDKNLTEFNIKSPEEAQNYSKPLIAFSREYKSITEELKAFLSKNLYKNQKVVEVNNSCAAKLEKLFYLYLEKPQTRSEFINEREKKDGIHLAICYYLAGMTDRFAINEYNLHFK